MNALPPIRDTLAHLDGQVQRLINGMAEVRRAQTLNLLVTGVVAGTGTLTAACLSAVLLVGGDASDSVPDPLAEEVRALHGKLDVLTKAQVAAAAAAMAARSTAALEERPTEVNEAGAGVASTGGNQAASSPMVATAPGNLVRVTLVPDAGEPQPFLVRPGDEAAALAVVDGLRPEDEVVAIGTGKPELQVLLERRLRMRALLARDRPKFEQVPTS